MRQAGNRLSAIPVLFATAFQIGPPARNLARRCRAPPKFSAADWAEPRAEAVGSKVAH